MTETRTRKPRTIQADVDIVSRLCKGCGYCVDACVQNCLAIATDINEQGYNYAYYLGEGCTGCGLCFYNCPEPSAITYRQSSQCLPA
jgi:NAD-dependent dihydropyrimidine dehydrogenase PreA subunit